MLITTNRQLTLWETVLPPGYQDLLRELAAMDALLDDPVFFRAYRAHLYPRWGRPSIPIETYLVAAAVFRFRGRRSVSVSTVQECSVGRYMPGFVQR